MAYSTDRSSSFSEWVKIFLTLTFLTGGYLLFLRWCAEGNVELREEHSEDFIILCQNTETDEILYNGPAASIDQDFTHRRIKVTRPDYTEIAWFSNDVSCSVETNTHNSP